MNAEDSVIAKEGSLEEVPYVEHSFYEVLMSTPSFKDLTANERIIWTMWYAMCNMFSVVCKMTIMIMRVTLMAWIFKYKFGKSTNLTFNN